MKYILILFFTTLFVSGCSTTKVPRPPSTYLLSTEKSQVQLMTEIRDMLVASKYQVKTFNSQTGFLVLQPRRFSVKKPDGSQVAVKQSMVIRQEGGSVSLRASYECEYPNEKNEKTYSACNNDDQEVGQKIRKIESLVLKQVRQKLEKAEATPEEKDLTVEPTSTSNPTPTPEAGTPPPQK